jgi:pantetheine-phosphate adenylyltransferase|tara:strand:- start:372 stop:866 length:495 start_codon:yes stop_codon:yes gene_type:complete
MKKVIYPGTFDPITYGHIDLIKKALNIFDNLIIAISDGNNKEYLFSAEEREILIKKSLFKDLKFKKKQIKVVTFNTLTTDFCKKMKSNIILRGLRATSDFEYEFQLSGMNKKLNDKVETVFLMSDPQNQIISSKLVKEIAELNGNVNKFTTKSVLKHLKLKLNG